jgi:phage shock protein PspC (stress-responsive transcriptional regulator)
MGKSKLRVWLVGAWQPFFMIAVSTVLLGSLLRIKLGSLVAGVTQPEQSLLLTRGMNSIINNPINAPYRLIQKLIVHVFGMNPANVRMASILMAFGFAYTFYFVVRHWYGRQVAIITSSLFITSAWFLHISRTGTPDVMQFGILLLLGFYLWLKREQRHPAFIVLVGAAVSLLLYTPGFLYLFVLATVWQRKRIATIFKSPFYAVITVAVMIVLLTPLAYNLQSREFAISFLGLPAAWLHDMAYVPRNILRTVGYLGVLGPNTPGQWLGRLPLLDFFVLIFSVLGAYTHAINRRLDRSKLVLGGFGVAIILTSLGGTIGLAILLPFCYLLVAAGISFTLDQWFTVFPRNPLAKYLISILLIVSVLTSAWYNVSHYFIAWPHAPQTQSVYKPLIDGTIAE